MSRSTFHKMAIWCLLLGLLFVAAPAVSGDTPTDEEQYMLEVVNRARLNPDAEVYRLRGQTWGDTGNPQPPDLNEAPRRPRSARRRVSRWPSTSILSSPPSPTASRC